MLRLRILANLGGGQQPFGWGDLSWELVVHRHQFGRLRRMP
jgi:hypothetical protein